MSSFLVSAIFDFAGWGEEEDEREAGKGIAGKRRVRLNSEELLGGSQIFRQSSTKREHHERDAASPKGRKVSLKEYAKSGVCKKTHDEAKPFPEVFGSYFGLCLYFLHLTTTETSLCKIKQTVYASRADRSYLRESR